jgi:orotate phosphoribosyltransferase
MAEVEELVKRLLHCIERTGALKKGEDFHLYSGSTSKYYFDGKLLTLDPEGNYLVGRLMFNLIRDTGVAAVGGLTIGADPIAGAIARESYLEGPPIPAFIVRETQKTHGRMLWVEGHLPTGVNRRVAIVDDVITKGGSMRKAIDRVKEYGCEVTKVVTVLDRHEGGSDKFKAEGYDFATILGSTPEGELMVEFPGLPTMQAAAYLTGVR